jgi:hypothetical protein
MLHVLLALLRFGLAFGALAVLVLGGMLLIVLP